MKNKAQFSQDVLAQALGTTIGAGAILLIGKVSGVLSSVDWGQVAVVLGFGTAVLGFLFSLGQWIDRTMQKRLEDERRDRDGRVREFLDDMTSEEAEAVRKRANPEHWKALSEEEKTAIELILARGLLRQRD